MVMVMLGVLRPRAAQLFLRRMRNAEQVYVARRSAMSKSAAR
jgi:hypothetical protein